MLRLIAAMLVFVTATSGCNNNTAPTGDTQPTARNPRPYPGTEKAGGKGPVPPAGGSEAGGGK